jgi:hypothetical protein
MTFVTTLGIASARRSDDWYFRHAYR